MKRRRVAAIACILGIAVLAFSAAGAEDAKPAAAPPEVKPPASAEALPAEPKLDVAQVAWDASLFAYKRPDRLMVEEATPTPEQSVILGRPPQEAADAPEPKAAGPAQPREIGAFNVIHLRFRDATGDIVPAILCTPKGKPAPFPLVIAVHGLTSHKAQVVAQVGPALAARGFAVLAADLPCHGERPGQPIMILSPGKIFEHYRTAVIAQRQLIDWAETRPELDVKAGVALVGYSLGSWMSSVVGPSEPRVKAMVLMVGGAMPIPAERLKDPRAAATDPRVSLPHFAGRPILLLNANGDFLVPPESARRLFAAAKEPKKQIWYEGGHLLPAEAYAEAARWIAETFGRGDRAISPAERRGEISL